jgi:hypothetical protein
MRSSTARSVPRALALLLGLIAIVQFGYHAGLGMAVRDVAPYETVLAQAVAGHFDPDAGPERFYGPFDGSHPSVLIHAPFYYRLVALAAWPLVALGLDPLPAVIVVGRILSAAGSLILFVAVFQIARMGSSTSRPGWLGVALAASSAIFGVLAVMVRPDTLGVALQTLACWLVLRRLENQDSRSRPPALVIAAVLFGFAFCMKQQNMTVAAVSAIWLAHAAARGRVPARDLAAAALAGMLVIAANLAAENLVTRGRMWQSVFVYPGGPFRAINFAGWEHVVSIFNISARRSLGLILLVLAALWVLRGRARVAPLDRRLLALLAVELVTLVPLCLYNAGAASNYALQAVVFAAILTARLLDRALDALGNLSRHRLLAHVVPLAAAIGLIGASDLYWILQSESIRGRASRSLASFELDPAVNAVPPGGRYFISHQDLNRTHGRASLIHDYWLYGAFEQIEAAEPRQRWLRDSLTEGPIRQVVAPDASIEIPGIRESLPELGYTRIARHGDLTVWQRLNARLR